jgi:hypothetical protein
MCLALAGDARAAELLDAYLDVFIDHYGKSRRQVPVDGNDDAHLRLRALVEGRSLPARREAASE